MKLISGRSQPPDWNETKLGWIKIDTTVNKHAVALIEITTSFREIVLDPEEAETLAAALNAIAKGLVDRH